MSLQKYCFLNTWPSYLFPILYYNVFFQMQFQVIKLWMIDSHKKLFGETLTIDEISRVQWYVF